MKKWMCLLLSLLMLSQAAIVFAEGTAEPAETEAPAPAVTRAPVDLSARRQIMMPGTVTAGRTVTVLAPFGGMLEEVLVKKGDFVSAQDLLFSLTTTKVYAPADGVVRSLSAQVGDDATFLQERYGALLYLEPTATFLIKTDTKNAYSADANQIIHVGETVYIGSRNTADRVGMGRVITVSGSSYTVEVTGGNLTLGENVVIYRDAAFSMESKIGTGKTELNTPVSISSTGVIFALHVTQGQEVKRGDLLLETVTGQTVYNPYPTNKILSGYAAVVATVDVNLGATVTQNQVMATLYPIDGFEVSVPVLESDLSEITVGDNVRVELANFFDEEPFEGKVTKISGLSSTDGDEPEYTVTVAFTARGIVRPGMNVNVYFNE